MKAKNYKKIKRKGFTLVELVVVMAIMGILSVGIMGIMNGSGAMYNKGRDLVAAKDVSSIAEDYISTMIAYKTSINLQPNATRPATSIGSVVVNNAIKADAFMLYSEGGKIMYQATATSTAEPLFDDVFYGSYTVNLSFIPQARADAYYNTICIKVDILDTNGNSAYSSEGTIVRLLNFGSASEKTINTFTTEYEDLASGRFYKNKIVAGTSYGYLYAS